jgi:hypothetical protein
MGVVGHDKIMKIDQRGIKLADNIQACDSHYVRQCQCNHIVPKE